MFTRAWTGDARVRGDALRERDVVENEVQPLRVAHDMEPDAHRHSSADRRPFAIIASFAIFVMAR